MAIGTIFSSGCDRIRQCSHATRAAFSSRARMTQTCPALIASPVMEWARRAAGVGHPPQLIAVGAACRLDGDAVGEGGDEAGEVAGIAVGRQLARRLGCSRRRRRAASPAARREIASCRTGSQPGPPSAGPASTSASPESAGPCRGPGRSLPGRRDLRRAWHHLARISETVRIDAIAAALGRGTATSSPLAEATAELGPLADLFTRDQDVSSAQTREALGSTPVHASIVTYLTS
jgi:hypothetical protein